MVSGSMIYRHALLMFIRSSGSCSGSFLYGQFLRVQHRSPCDWTTQYDWFGRLGHLGLEESRTYVV